MRAGLSLVVVALAAGCVTDPQKRDAINDVNREFREQYERILLENGTRRYRAKRPQAFNALRTALVRLGMRIGDQSQEIGYLNVFAGAPTPLERAEWDEAQKKDLPMLREILTRHLGLLGYLVKFEPEGLDIVINATAIEVAGGTEVSLTMRMREVAPAPSGMPRRDYAPPSAVRMGLDKIWRELERELGAL
ncbi:MAG: hypothetical protein K0R40_1799 [Burkholderiales bacterium]|jgi:hypothetical protein|nr:hypothetical protein [Burkholderiales bacterium]